MLVHLSRSHPFIDCLGDSFDLFGQLNALFVMTLRKDRVRTVAFLVDDLF